MAHLTLSSWASLEVYRVLLVFVRITAAMMLLPGFGEPAIPGRIRLLAGLAIAVTVASAIDNMPAVPPTALGLGYGVVAEAVSGAVLGALCRTLISAVQSAGQIISQTINLSNIFAAGLAIDQSMTVGAALYAGVVAILFASGAHHTILRGLIESYHLLPPAEFPNPTASATVLVGSGARALRLAAQISLPFLVLALLFNASLAAANRALPAIPVFMIANPLLVALGLYLLAATVPAILDPALGEWSDLSQLLR
ncbi:MAG: flagellar biosynthetic protein FliR [Alphaproteobacteria bacterium]|nr:flagellar biosynthetic protein FliR [Alphaproteobacteria bacterium]